MVHAIAALDARAELIKKAIAELPLDLRESATRAEEVYRDGNTILEEFARLQQTDETLERLLYGLRARLNLLRPANPTASQPAQQEMGDAFNPMTRINRAFLAALWDSDSGSNITQSSPSPSKRPGDITSPLPTASPP